MPVSVTTDALSMLIELFDGPEKNPKAKEEDEYIPLDKNIEPTCVRNQPTVADLQATISRPSPTCRAEPGKAEPPVIVIRVREQ